MIHLLLLCSDCWRPHNEATVRNFEAMKGQAQSRCLLGTFVIRSLPQAGVTLFPLCYVQFLCCKRIRLFTFHAMLLQVVMAQGSF